MRVRLGEAAMVPDDFRSTDTVRFPTCLDGLRKHFLDITRVLDASDVDFRRHSIRGAEMDAADTAQTLYTRGKSLGAVVAFCLVFPVILSHLGVPLMLRR